MHVWVFRGGTVGGTGSRACQFPATPAEGERIMTNPPLQSGVQRTSLDDSEPRITSEAGEEGLWRALGR